VIGILRGAHGTGTLSLPGEQQVAVPRTGARGPAHKRHARCPPRTGWRARPPPAWSRWRRPSRVPETRPWFRGRTPRPASVPAEQGAGHRRWPECATQRITSPVRESAGTSLTRDAMSELTTAQPPGTPTWIDLSIPDLDRAMTHCGWADPCTTTGPVISRRDG
jgi:hypothetical protein